MHPDRHSLGAAVVSEGVSGSAGASGSEEASSSHGATAPATTVHSTSSKKVKVRIPAPVADQPN